jgi:hypothetical protein
LPRSSCCFSSASSWAMSGSRRPASWLISAQ